MSVRRRSRPARRFGHFAHILLVAQGLDYSVLLATFYAAYTFFEFPLQMVSLRSFQAIEQALQGSPEASPSTRKR